jgi:acetyltransferase
VRLDITDDKALEEAMEEMPAEVYLVQKMAPEGVETIIGGKRDAQFGPVVVFGLGGIFVEVLKDVTMRVAPVDEVIAAQIIGEIRGASLLKGARGHTAADTAALVQTIARVSRLLVDHPEIARLDINPFRVFGQGQGALALDIKIEEDERPPAPEEP